ncbi:hypothetical protein C0389_04555 [bacterium]|nr:hypothetical protein [bacterium]
MRLFYKYSIVLTLSVLSWSCSRDKIADPADDSIPPVTPSDLNVFAAFDGQIGIEWKKNNESNLKGYFIYRSINKPENYKKISIADKNYFIDDSLYYDSTYYYKVSAVNRNNMESPLTVSVSAQPKNIYSPPAPNRIIINARNWENSIGINLTWNPSVDSDVLGYKIYRSITSGFEADSLHYLDFTDHFSYFDTRQLLQLTKYHYKIVAVDRGGLKSPATSEVSDLILNSPRLIYPASNSTINSLTEFRFLAVSKPAAYKLVIFSNEIFGIVQEINFSSDKVNEEIKVDVIGLYLTPFRTYFWRVYTYTASDTNPNSYSNFSAFTYYSSNRE